MKGDIEYSKGMSAIRKAGSISFCFNEISKSCEGNIVNSHGLQENGKLNLLEADYNGNNKIMSFEKTQKHKRFSDLPMPKPQGKSNTSTFKGFCQHHDTTIFSNIENFSYENTSDMNFRHSYRSFAYTYHYFKRQNKMFSSDSIGKKMSTKYPMELQALNLALESFESKKITLNGFLKNQQFDSLIYFVFETDFIPFASCSTIHLQYDFKGRKLKDYPISTDLILTCFPEEEKHITILAGFKHDFETASLLEQLENLSNIEIEYIISALCLNYTNSTYMSPALWINMGLEKQKEMMEQIVDCFVVQRRNPEYKVGFNKSAVNLFDFKQR